MVDLFLVLMLVLLLITHQYKKCLKNVIKFQINLVFIDLQTKLMLKIKKYYFLLTEKNDKLFKLQVKCMDLKKVNIRRFIGSINISKFCK